MYGHNVCEQEHLLDNHQQDNLISESCATEGTHRKGIFTSSQAHPTTLQGRGYSVNIIHCNGEYKSLIKSVQDKLQTTLNFANSMDHVPEAERNNQTIKEQIQAAFHRLPYKALPNMMFWYLAMECTSKLNLFPAKGGISLYYSPRVLFNQWAIDYNKEFTVYFGTYVQAQPNLTYTNTNTPRTLDAIYLRYQVFKAGMKSWI